MKANIFCRNLGILLRLPQQARIFNSKDYEQNRTEQNSRTRFDNSMQACIHILRDTNENFYKLKSFILIFLITILNLTNLFSQCVNCPELVLNPTFKNNITSNQNNPSGGYAFCPVSQSNSTRFILDWLNSHGTPHLAQISGTSNCDIITNSNAAITCMAGGYSFIYSGPYSEGVFTKPTFINPVDNSKNPVNIISNNYYNYILEVNANNFYCTPTSNDGRTQLTINAASGLSEDCFQPYNGIQNGTSNQTMSEDYIYGTSILQKFVNFKPSQNYNFLQVYNGEFPDNVQGADATQVNLVSLKCQSSVQLTLSFNRLTGQFGANNNSLGVITVGNPSPAAPAIMAYTFLVDGIQKPATSFNQYYNSFSLGNHTVQVRTIDVNGCYAEASMSFSINNLNCNSASDIRLLDCAPSGTNLSSLNITIPASTLFNNISSIGTNVSNRKFYVRGKLIIDRLQDFTNCEFFMEADAEIIINVPANDAVTFQSFSNIHRCNNSRWKGIKVGGSNTGRLVFTNSTLEGAYEGITLLDNANTDISKSTFKDNLIGIFSPMSITKKNYNGIDIRGCNFQISNSTATETTYGVYIRDLKYIGLSDAASQRNNFSNLTYGVIASNSGINIKNSIFSVLSNAIEIINGTGSTIENNNISNGNYGILIRDGNLGIFLLKDNIISNAVNGIELSKVNNAAFTLLRNQVLNAGTGINCRLLSNLKQFVITGNSDFTTPNITATFLCIQVSECSGVVKYITDNYMSGINSGGTLSIKNRSGKTNIIHNRMKSTYNSAQIRNSDEVYLKDNMIESQNSTALNAYWSNDLRLCCNTLDAKYAISAYGSNDWKIRNSDMPQNNHGKFNLSEVMLGVQVHAGNSWYNTTASSATYSGSAPVFLSRFTYNLDDGYVTPSAFTSNLFVQTPGNASFCNVNSGCGLQPIMLTPTGGGNGGTVGPGTGGPGDPVLFDCNALYAAIAQGYASQHEYSSQSQWFAQYYLFHLLKYYPNFSWKNCLHLDSFFTANPILNEYDDTENSIETAGNASTTQWAAWQANDGSISTAAASLSSFATMIDNGSNYATYENQIIQLSNQINNAADANQSLWQAVQPTFTSDLTASLVKVNALLTPKPFLNRHKEMMKLIIKIKQLGISSVTNGEWNYIYATGNMCPNLEGKYVYEARGIVENYGDMNLLLNDSLLCQNTTPRALKQELDEARVYPNPSSGIINVALPQSESPYTIRIKDLFGKEVKRYFVHDRAENYTLDLTDNQAGIYMITISVKNNVVSTQKIIIIK